MTLYKAMLELVGLGSYWPYRVVAILLHLSCAGLVFVMARKRAGLWLALVAACLVLFFNSGWEDMLWAFQFFFVTSLVAGLGMILALDGRGRGRDVAAFVLLVAALASSGVGLCFLPAALLMIAVRGRDHLSRLWVPAGAFGLYFVWWLQYGPRNTLVGSPRHHVAWLPTSIFDMASAAVGGLLGLGRPSTSTPLPGFPFLPSAQPNMLEWGRVLLLAAVVAMVWRLSRLGWKVSSTFVGVVSALVAFWVITALTRSPNPATRQRADTSTWRACSSSSSQRSWSAASGSSGPLRWRWCSASA